MANGGDGGKNKKAAFIGMSSLFLFSMVVTVLANGVSGSGGPKTNMSNSNKEIKTLCESTDYKKTCEKTLEKAGANTSDPRELIKAGFHVAIEDLKSAIENSATLKNAAKDPRAKQALDACGELMDYAIDDLLLSFDRITDNFDVRKLDDYIEDLKIWLSGAITFQETCIDGFENVTGDTGEKMKNLLKMSKEVTINGLGMVNGITSFVTSLGLSSFGRRQLTEESNQQNKDQQNKEEEEEEPSWVRDRRGLLQATGANIKADVVVAKDGSGKYKTLSAALNDIPKKSNKTFVIYVKEGVYQEQVMIDKSMTWVMLIGDGPTKTKITNSKNNVDGVPTFKSGTVSAMGTNFIAKDIGFENTAGAAKGQAVALLVQSDMSIFYNCQMDGYQDTLYPHAHRQFYRDCTITGTVDFIFGNAAVVFQNCKIIVRKPIGGQSCLVTAQGRTLEKEPTGIVLQNCVISADPAYFPVRQINKAYLGRPWKKYSRTIIMQSQIDDLIQPEGWHPWEGNFALNTLFYSEFNNRGPGAGKQNRVKWEGIKQITTEIAAEFTAGRFIHGDSWIKSTGVPYTSGMMAV